MENASDRMEFVLSRPVVTKPGEVWKFLLRTVFHCSEINCIHRLCPSKRCAFVGCNTIAAGVVSGYSAYGTDWRFG